MARRSFFRRILVGYCRSHFVRLVAILGISFSFSCPAFAGLRIAYVWADNPARPSYVPSASYLKKDDKPVHITRLGIGHYRVVLGTLVSGHGNVQVSAYGQSANSCQVASWGSGIANILCFNSAGKPINSRFSVLAINANNEPTIAYVLGNRPRASHYSPNERYSYVSRGTAQITRRSAGRYQVRLGRDVATTDANIQVTPYGATPRRCGVVSWGGGSVGIRCTDPSGKPADTQFSMLAVKGAAGSAGFAFTWANYAKRIDYAPSAAYTYAPGATPKIRRDSKGHYSVTLNGTMGNIQTTAYGAAAVTCNPISWGKTTVNILCFDAAGRPVDSRFTLLSTLRGGAASSQQEVASNFPLPTKIPVPIKPSTSSQPHWIHIPKNQWLPLLNRAVSGLSVRINDFDRSKSQSYVCGQDGLPPHCGPAFKSFIRNDSYIRFRAPYGLRGIGSFTTRFTPGFDWNNPFLFLVNDLDMPTGNARVTVHNGQLVLVMPFESRGREIVAACHNDLRCGWGPPDGNNKPGAEINNLVIRAPFNMSVYRGGDKPEIHAFLGNLTFSGNIRRAGACRNNALAVFCDLFAGNIEQRVRTGLQHSLNVFVASDRELISTLDEFSTVEVCHIATTHGKNCSSLNAIGIGRNGTLWMKF